MPFGPVRFLGPVQEFWYRLEEGITTSVPATFHISYIKGERETWAERLSIISFGPVQFLGPFRNFCME